MELLILAGGKSRRMGGRHKGNLILDGESFTQRLIRELGDGAEHIYLSCGTEYRETADVAEKCILIKDIWPGCGPIGGLHAGCAACRADAFMAAACDMPFLKAGLYRYLADLLEDYDGVVPVVRGRMHPLAAVYRKRIQSSLEEQIQAGNYRIINALEKNRIRYADITGMKEYEEMLCNVNTEEEYDKIKLGRHEKN